MGARHRWRNGSFQQLHDRLGKPRKYLGSRPETISTVTVYVHPARYTSEFLKESDTFTVSFYPDQYRKALGYMGSHSGRDGDKAAAAGLTPVAIGDGVTYEEANLTFLCKTVSASVCQRRSRTGNPGILRFYAESLPGFQRRLAATHRVCGTDSRRGRQTIKGGEPWDFNSGQLQFCSYFMDAIWENGGPETLGNPDGSDGKRKSREGQND